MGNKGVGAEVPEQVVQFLSLLHGIADDAYAISLLACLVHKLGGMEIASRRGVLGEDVEPVGLVPFIL